MNILDALLHSLEHPLVETLKMTPILFLAYLLMEWLEHHESSKLMGLVNKSRRVGPLLGSALGLIPQCGFSGAIAGMYAAGTVTAGTLLAVILATSDEKLPLMLGARLSAGLIAAVLVLDSENHCFFVYVKRKVFIFSVKLHKRKRFFLCKRLFFFLFSFCF